MALANVPGGSEGRPCKVPQLSSQIFTLPNICLHTEQRKKEDAWPIELKN